MDRLKNDYCFRKVSEVMLGNIFCFVLLSFLYEIYLGIIIIVLSNCYTNVLI